MQIIYTTVPDKESALRLVKELIKEQVVACANFFPIESVYFWEEKLVEDNEYAVLLKTANVSFEDIETAVNKNHPYQIPCILKIDAETTLPFGNWINKQVK